MKRPTILVVGDIFGDFATHCHAITHKDVNSVLSMENLSDSSFLLGQGLSTEQARAADEFLSSRGARPINGNVPLRADGSLSHKRKEQNTLIGIPYLVGGAIYSAPMLVDARSELMSDHQTGLHLQGMLQVEAYRQFMLALFEVFHPLPEGRKSYAVINKMEVSFETFMFPLPATIEAKIEDLDIHDRRTRISTRMRAIQNNKPCSQCITTFTYYPADVISEKEAALALAATRAAFDESTVECKNSIETLVSVATGQTMPAQPSA